MVSGYVISEDFRVSTQGTDRLGCGRPRSVPCQTLSLATSQTRTGDALLLDGGVPGVIHDVCNQDGLALRHSLLISSYDGQAKLGCNSETSGELRSYLTKLVYIHISRYKGRHH